MEEINKEQSSISSPQKKRTNFFVKRQEDMSSLSTSIQQRDFPIENLHLLEYKRELINTVLKES